MPSDVFIRSFDIPSYPTWSQTYAKQKQVDGVLAPGVRLTKDKSAGFPKSRYVSRPRDPYEEVLDGSKIWQAPLLYNCGDARPI